MTRGDDVRAERGAAGVPPEQMPRAARYELPSLFASLLVVATLLLGLLATTGCRGGGDEESGPAETAIEDLVEGDESVDESADLLPGAAVTDDIFSPRRDPVPLPAITYLGTTTPSAVPTPEEIAEFHGIDNQTATSGQTTLNSIADQEPHLVIECLIECATVPGSTPFEDNLHDMLSCRTTSARRAALYLAMSTMTTPDEQPVNLLVDARAIISPGGEGHILPLCVLGNGQCNYSSTVSAYTKLTFCCIDRVMCYCRNCPFCHRPLDSTNERATLTNLPDFNLQDLGTYQIYLNNHHIKYRTKDGFILHAITRSHVAPGFPAFGWVYRAYDSDEDFSSVE